MIIKSSNVTGLLYNIIRAEYAFNPKDGGTPPTIISKANSKDKSIEIEEKIKRLSQTLTYGVI